MERPNLYWVIGMSSLSQKMVWILIGDEDIEEWAE